MDSIGSARRTVRDLFDLNGRVALVIGGTGFLGTAICQALAEAGATVAIGSRSLAKAEEAAYRLPGNSTRHAGFACDMNDEPSIRQSVDQVSATLGGLHILINSVTHPSRARINEADQHELLKVLTVDLVGPFIVAQQAARHMRLAGSGSIINIGSMYGMVGSYPEIYDGVDNLSPPAYHASKGGLIHLTRYEAVYWARDHIRVNCISPGPFPHPRHYQDREEFVKRLSARVPLGRTGIPWEIKGAVVFLASDASSYITGHNLVVDGGWTAW